MVFVGLVGLAIVVYVAVGIFASRTQKPVHRLVRIRHEGSETESRFGNSITLSTWNLGYAGLGADSDFVADGGTSLFPPSWTATRRNLKAILEVASNLEADVNLFQEVSDCSPLSYWVPLCAKLRRLYPNRFYAFQKDIATKWLIWPIRISHGVVAASRIWPVTVETVPLPLESSPAMGLIKRLYALQVLRFDAVDDEIGWTIINLHLSAFDEGAHRERQVSAAMSFAESEYKKGRHVILGGDWNLDLSVNGTLNEEDSKVLFWLRSFPRELLPDGWAVVAPVNNPTVRALDKPYKRGVTPTATIDGFIISPNIESLSIMSLDTEFGMSDHQPVVACFRLRTHKWDS